MNSIVDLETADTAIVMVHDLITNYKKMQQLIETDQMPIRGIAIWIVKEQIIFAGEHKILRMVMLKSYISKPKEFSDEAAAAIKKIIEEYTLIHQTLKNERANLEIRVKHERIILNNN